MWLPVIPVISTKITIIIILTTEILENIGEKKERYYSLSPETTTVNNLMYCLQGSFLKHYLIIVYINTRVFTEYFYKPILHISYIY